MTQPITAQTAISVLQGIDTSSPHPPIKRIDGYRYITANGSNYKLDDLAKVLLTEITKPTVDLQIVEAATKLTAIYKKTDKWPFGHNADRKALEKATVSIDLTSRSNPLEATINVIIPDAPMDPSIETASIDQIPARASEGLKSARAIEKERLAKYETNQPREEFYQEEISPDVLASLGVEVSSNPSDQTERVNKVRIAKVHARIPEETVDSTLLAQMKKANKQGEVDNTPGSFVGTPIPPQKHAKEACVLSKSSTPDELESCLTHKDQQHVMQQFIKSTINAAMLEGPALDYANKENEHLSIGECDVGIAWDIGHRPNMEDEHLAIPFDITIQGQLHTGSLFGVFDGHNGQLAATFVKRFLPPLLKARLEEENFRGLNPKGIVDALSLAIVDLHEEFCFACDSLDSATDIDRSSIESERPSLLVGEETKSLNAGTTAVVMLKLDGQDMYTATVGDARIIQVNPNGTTVQITEDADASDPHYQAEIKAMGGGVQTVKGIYKINGQLAVGKAIGDRKQDGINARPTITRVPKEQFTDGTIFVASCDSPYEMGQKKDGTLYKVANSSQIGAATYATRASSVDLSADQIVQDVISAGSQDNTTIMIIRPSIPHSTR